MALPSQGQAFEMIELFDPLMVHGPAFPPQQDVEARGPEPPALRGQFAQPLPQGRLIGPGPWSVLLRRPPQPDEPTGSPQAQPKAFDHLGHGHPFRLGLYEFFARTNFKAWMSRTCSATTCFSRRFSSSRAFRRRSSLTVRPLYLAFQA
jgi:hypothetical protein